MEVKEFKDIFKPLSREEFMHRYHILTAEHDYMNVDGFLHTPSIQSFAGSPLLIDEVERIGHELPKTR